MLSALTATGSVEGRTGTAELTALGGADEEVEVEEEEEEEEEEDETSTDGAGCEGAALVSTDGSSSKSTWTFGVAG